jgi:hypothetical protein
MGVQVREAGHDLIVNPLPIIDSTFSETMPPKNIARVGRYNQ